MQYHVTMTSKAAEQVLQIADHIANTLMEKDAADRWYEQLCEKIDSLTSFPNRFQLVNEEPWRGFGLRKMVVHNYHVLYWIDEDTKTVIITAVFYYRFNQIPLMMNMPLR